MRREAAVAASVASGAAASVALAAALATHFSVVAGPAASRDLTILHPQGALQDRSDLHYAGRPRGALEELLSGSPS
jgi:hypothetical protein